MAAALELLQELGPGVASEPVPERPADHGPAAGLLPPPPQQQQQALARDGAAAEGGGSVSTPSVAQLLGSEVMNRGSAGSLGGGGAAVAAAAAGPAAAARLVSPAEAALWLETVAGCADALGDWPRLEIELQRPLMELGVQLPGASGGGTASGLLSSAAAAISEALPRTLLSGSGGSGGGGDGAAAMLLRRVLRSALFQLTEADFQGAAAAAAAAALLQGGGGGGGGAAAAAEAAGSDPSEGPALLVLRLLEQLDGGGGGREAASYAAAAAPLEVVAAEMYRACRRGSWERCLSVLQDALARLRTRWSGLHPLSTAARTATLSVLQPLAEIHETVRQLHHGRSSTSSFSSSSGGGAMQQQPAAVTSTSTSAVRQLQALVEGWRRRGLGGAVPVGGGGGGGGGGNPTATGSALQTVLQVRRLLLEAAANCILPAGAASAGGGGGGGAAAAASSSYRELQRAARAALAANRFAAAEAAVRAGCADMAAEALPPPPPPAAAAAVAAEAAAGGDGAEGLQGRRRQAARQLRLFRAHVDTAAAQAAAEPGDGSVYGVVSELLRAMRPWHREAVKAGLLGGRAAAESELAQSRALLVLSGDPDPTSRQQYLAVRLATALSHGAAAAAFQPATATATEAPQQGHAQAPGPTRPMGRPADADADTDADAAAATVTAARASAHFALLCGRVLRATTTHGSAAEREDPTAASLEELTATTKRKQVAAAVRASGGDLAACIVRHLLRAMALAGSGTVAAAAAAAASAAPTTGGDDGGGGEAPERLQILAAHLRLQVPVVLSVLRSSDAAAEAFRQGWAAVPVGLFLPWVPQMTSMVNEAAAAAAAAADGGGAAAAADPLLGPLTALAITYPQRLYAPLRMVGGGGGGAAATAARAAVFAPLLAATASPVVSEFVDALEQMTYPAQRWQVFAARIGQALSRGDVEAAVEVWRKDAWPSLFGRYQPNPSGPHHHPPAPASAAAGAAPAAAAAFTSRRQVAGAAAAAAEPYNVVFARRYRAAFEEAFGGADGSGLRQLSERTRQQFLQQQQQQQQSLQQQQPAQQPQQSQPQHLLGRTLLRAFLAAAHGAGPGNSRAGGQRQWEALQAAGGRSLELLSPWFRSYEAAVAAAGAGAGMARMGSHSHHHHHRQRQRHPLLLLLPSMAFATASSPPPAEPGAAATTTGGSSGSGSSGYGSGLPPLGGEDVAPVAVVGFKRMVTVFSSKQRPKLITLYCSDLSTREFVVKGGEDVRLDERIQQLFDVMNGLAIHDAACARRSLRVSVYDVVPLSPSVGLLQFVPGTKPLQGCLVDSPERSEQEAQAIDQYASFIRAASAPPGQPPPPPDTLPTPRDYWSMYMRADATSTVRNFKQVASCLPAGLLRAGLLRSSGHSPELFLTRRSALTASLTAGCVAGYLAGVGDRHTSNVLMQPATGALVHIDFGYSFGSATQVLPIPELVPFRLTPQLLGALQPHSGREVLAPGMAAALAALSAPAARQLLGAVMEVFLREPVADWQQEAMMLRAGGGAGGGARQAGGAAAAVVEEQQQQQQQEEEEEDSRVLAARLARSRVDTALQKLARRHPALILVEELRCRHGATPHFPALTHIVQGGTSDSGSGGGGGGGGPTPYRARPDLLQRSGPLTPEEQARCLMDLASDPNVLGRMYLGWRPYL
ncbi:hypothetical protein PLESTF_001221800 [Pleodorina starrii]|nr:hypothetical protein PLESTF_001221800 [Pleodorina starrii]